MRGRLGAPSTSRVCAVGCPRPGCDLVVPWARRAKYNYSGIARPICVTPGHRATRKKQKKTKKQESSGLPGRPAPAGAVWGIARPICVTPGHRATRKNKKKQKKQESSGLLGRPAPTGPVRGHRVFALCSSEAACGKNKQEQDKNATRIERVLRVLSICPVFISGARGARAMSRSSAVLPF